MAKLVAGTFAAVAVLSTLGAAARAQTAAAGTSASSADAGAGVVVPSAAAPGGATAPVGAPPRPSVRAAEHEERHDHEGHRLGEQEERHGERGEHGDHDGHDWRDGHDGHDDRVTKGADPETSELKSGRLMRYGVTVGLAAAIHIPVPGSTGLRGVGASALPYVALFPGVWTQSGVTRAYCTAKWIGEDGPENAATAAAVKESIASLREETKKRGTGDLAGFYAPLKDNAHDKEPLPPEDAMDARAKLWTTLRGENNTPLTPETAEAELVACSNSLREATTASDFPATCATQHVHELIKAYSGWDTDRGGRCTWTHVGGYVGLPFDYSVNDNLGGHTASREHSPFISSGFVFAPSSFISFLLGVTLNNVERGASVNTSAHQVVVPAITAGLGGNIDILGALLPGK